ncbi:MAG: tRNA (adenosine(37)-N6)-threonylcarbamoyltransferase complex ATPase subunit type 1 TsaE [Vicinamibacterales bacterium]
MSRPLVTRSEAQTSEAGRNLAAALAPDSIVLLSGDLGAGKTAFVKGLAEGLGIDPMEVSSPTFTLIQEYRGGRLTLYHVDLYRLSPREVEDLGLEEIVSSGGVTAIEWPDRLPYTIAGAITVAIEYADDGSRGITVAR